MSAGGGDEAGDATGGQAGDAVVVEDLRIAIAGGGPEVVESVSFAIAEGEVLGLVGESGSGKTTVGLALLGHARRGLQIVGGRVRVGDLDVLKLPDEQRRRLRGSVVSYVPQDPASSLNPALRVGIQLSEVLQAHQDKAHDGDRAARLAEMMREVALPDEPKFLRRYPHELSGGQQQRIGLAMAFANRPRLIVLDEPTTGLDVTTQAHVLATVRELSSAHRVAALYVSHDLAVVAALARRVAVMYSGRIVELGSSEQLFSAAGHPYTRRLVGAIPRLRGTRTLVGIPGRAPSSFHRPTGCAFAPRCSMREDACDVALPELVAVGAVLGNGNGSGPPGDNGPGPGDNGPGPGDEHLVRCIRAGEVRSQRVATMGERVTRHEIVHDGAALSIQAMSASYGRATVVHDVELAIAPQECLALVGESGSGKTTTARAVSGLHRDWTGHILLNGVELATSARARSRDARRQIQYVFQNPYGSLNPRHTIGDIVRQPIELFGTARGSAVDAKVNDMLERVSLTAAYARRYPEQLSGGERQRVAIARALVCEPAVLVCDEVTSALDVSVQAAIVELLGGLQRDLGLAMLFVTHNLPLVRSIAQRVAVMSAGRIVELGAVEDVLGSPRDEYTRRLLANTPSLETAAEEVGAEVVDPATGAVSTVDPATGAVSTVDPATGTVSTVAPDLRAAPERIDT